MNRYGQTLRWNGSSDKRGAAGMSVAMRAAARELSVRAVLTFPTGAEAALSGNEIVAFTIEEGADSALLPGCVLSAAISMELDNGEGQWRSGGSLRGGRPLMGSTLEVFVSADCVEAACGAFIISNVSADEQSGVVRLSGSDSIASELSGAFADTLSYPASLGTLWAHLVGQTRYVWSGTLPCASALIAEPPDWNGATLRRVAGWIAQAAGCFVRVSRTGALEIVPCMNTQVEELGPDEYIELRDGFDAFGPVCALRARPSDGGLDIVAGNGAIGAELLIENNPLYDTADAAALAQATFNRLSGLTLHRAEFRWRGDPEVGVGTRVKLTDTFGDAFEGVVTRQTLRFCQGFYAECACELPDTEYNSARAITPEGGLNAAALTGRIDGGLLRAGSVQAQAVAAESITAAKLAAGSVTADKVAAGAITADKLAADAVSAQSVEAVVARLGQIKAGKLTADALYTALADVFELTAASVAAGSIAADQLAAALADFVSAYVKTGSFDFATAQNLLAGALTLKKGHADSMTISNLAVTSANLLSATLGELILRGSDGAYYTVFVGADGEITSAQTALSQSQIDAGEADGRKIVETSANIGALNAETLDAQSAVIGEILSTALTTGRITAAKALLASATIPALYATAIEAVGDGLELSSNQSIRALVGTRIVRGDQPPYGPAQDELWLDTGVQPNVLRRWRGLENVTDTGRDAGGWSIVNDTDDVRQTVSALSSTVAQLPGELSARLRRDELETVLRFTEEGVEIGRSDSDYSTQIDNAGYSVRQHKADIASFSKRTLTVPNLRIADPKTTSGAVFRAASDGGVFL